MEGARFNRQQQRHPVGWSILAAAHLCLCMWMPAVHCCSISCLLLIRFYVLPLCLCIPCPVCRLRTVAGFLDAPPGVLGSLACLVGPTLPASAAASLQLVKFACEIFAFTSAISSGRRLV